MSFFHSLLSSDTGIPFQFGNLTDLYPSETYAQITARRQDNWNLLKTACNTLKVTGGTLSILGDRVEFYRPLNDRIDISNGQTLKMFNHDSDLVFYPFTSRAEVTYFSPFNFLYGSTGDFRNTTIKCAQKQGRLETYDVVLKKGGNLKLIELTGTIRPDFWIDLQVGNTIYYTDQPSDLAESRIVASFDSTAKTITVTVDIGAGIAVNATGIMARIFSNEGIPEADYLTYGRFWIMATGPVRGQVGIAHGNTANTIETNLNFENVTLQNWQGGLEISSNAWHVTFDNLTFDNNGVGFGGFRGVLNNAQSIIGSTMTFTENGWDGVGQITVDSSLIYGAGGYIHPIVIVEIDTLTCIDNYANGFRQYSSSLETQVPYETVINTIIASGNGEYDFYASNCMPVTVNYIEADDVRVGGTLTVNGGEIRRTLNGNILSQPPEGTPVTWTFNDVDLYGTMLTSFAAPTELVHDINFNNCNFYIPLLSSVQDMLGGTAELNINGGTIYKTASVGTWNPATGAPTGVRGSNFISGHMREVNIDGLEFNEYPYMFLFDNAQPQRPYLETFLTRTFNNIDFKCYGIWLDVISNTAGSVSNIFVGTDCVIRNNFTSNEAGKYYVQSLQGRSGTIAKTIVASKTYAQIGAITNILEVDWEHDYYETSGTINAIVVANSWASSYSSNPIYSKPIRIYAVGGNITFNTFDATLRPTSNIIGTNGTVILEGNYLDITIDNHRVLQTGTVQATPTVATGNGVTTDFHNVLSDWILDPTVLITVTAGPVSATADANGVFNHADVVGIVDPWTGKYQFIFTNPVPNLTNIVVTYNKPNVWKNTGAWILP